MRVFHLLGYGDEEREGISFVVFILELCEPSPLVYNKKLRGNREDLFIHYEMRGLNLENIGSISQTII